MRKSKMLPTPSFAGLVNGGKERAPKRRDCSGDLLELMDQPGKVRGGTPKATPRLSKLMGQ